MCGGVSEAPGGGSKARCGQRASEAVGVWSRGSGHRLGCGKAGACGLAVLSSEAEAGSTVKFAKRLGALPFSRRIGLAAGAGVVVIVLVSILGSSGGSAQSTAKPAAAHSFSLAALGQSGRQVSLNQYDGHPVMVNFFASWCPPCKKETPLLAGFYRTHRGQVTILGIDVNDGTAAAQSFLRKYGVSYPVASDPTAATAAKYGVISLPQTFFLNAAHQIVQRDFGALTQATLTAGLAKAR